MSRSSDYLFRASEYLEEVSRTLTNVASHIWKASQAEEDVEHKRLIDELLEDVKQIRDVIGEFEEKIDLVISYLE